MFCCASPQVCAAGPPQGMWGVTQVQLLPRGYRPHLDGLLRELHQLGAELRQRVERHDRPGDHPARLAHHVRRQVRRWLQTHRPRHIFTKKLTFSQVKGHFNFSLVTLAGQQSGNEQSASLRLSYATSWPSKTWRTSRPRKYVQTGLVLTNTSFPVSTISQLYIIKVLENQIGPCLCRSVTSWSSTWAVTSKSTRSS